MRCFRFQNISRNAIAARNNRANTARTHDQCTAMSTATLTATYDVDSLGTSHKRAVPGKVLDPTAPRPMRIVLA